MNDTAGIKADAPIREVTVYPDSAMVKRTATVELEVRPHTILFADLIPEINEDTLRVAAAGQGEIRVAGVELKRVYLPVESSAKLQELREKLQHLQDEKQQLDNELKLRTEERQFLEAFKTFAGVELPREIVTKMPTGAELSEAYQFYSARLAENLAGTFETQRRLRDLKSSLEAAQKEYDAVKGNATKEIRHVEVAVEAAVAGRYEISLSYQVWGASWRPSYDARADLNAAQLELVSYGVVNQTTGEDWREVEMYLSTAKPATGGTMPEITPWVLRPHAPIHYRAMAAGAAAAPAPVVCESMAEDEYALRNERAPREVYSESEFKSTSLLYKLPRRVTVASDGVEHKLPLSRQMLAAGFEYSAYPLAVPAAYLRSRVTNAPDLQLLAGPANIFLDGDYTGASRIGNIGPGEEFDLYFGQDENVKVKRELIAKKSNDRLLGGNKQVAYQYKLTVENYKAGKIAVKLFEAIPVSEDGKIKVRIGQVSEEPHDKDWQDKKGIWLWELALEPKAKKEIVLSYTVEYPREMIVQGLDS